MSSEFRFISVTYWKSHKKYTPRIPMLKFLKIDFIFRYLYHSKLQTLNLLQAKINFHIDLYKIIALLNHGFQMLNQMNNQLQLKISVVRWKSRPFCTVIWPQFKFRRQPIFFSFHPLDMKKIPFIFRERWVRFEHPITVKSSIFFCIQHCRSLASFQQFLVLTITTNVSLGYRLKFYLQNHTSLSPNLQIRLHPFLPKRTFFLDSFSLLVHIHNQCIQSVRKLCTSFHTNLYLLPQLCQFGCNFLHHFNLPSIMVFKLEMLETFIYQP